MAKTYLFDETLHRLKITDTDVLGANYVTLLQVYNPTGVLMYQSPNWTLNTTTPSGGYFDPTIRIVSIGSGVFGTLPIDPTTLLSVAGQYSFAYKTYDRTSTLDPVPFVLVEEKVLYEYKRVAQIVTLTQDCAASTIASLDSTDYTQTFPNTSQSIPIKTYDSRIENITTGAVTTGSSPYLVVINGAVGIYQGATNPLLEYDLVSTNILYKNYSIKDRYRKTSSTLTYNCDCQIAYCKAVTIAQCRYEKYIAETNFNIATQLKESWLDALAMVTMIAGDCSCVKGNYATYLAALGDCGCGCNE